MNAPRLAWKNSIPLKSGGFLAKWSISEKILRDWHQNDNAINCTLTYPPGKNQWIKANPFGSRTMVCCCPALLQAEKQCNVHVRWSPHSRVSIARFHVLFSVGRCCLYPLCSIDIQHHPNEPLPDLNLHHKKPTKKHTKELKSPTKTK